MIVWGHVLRKLLRRPLHSQERVPYLTSNVGPGHGQGQLQFICYVFGLPDLRG